MADGNEAVGAGLMALGPAGATVGAVMSIASFAQAQQSERLLEKAKRRRDRITAIQNVRARDTFKRNFFAAQAQQLTQSVGTGLDSSAGLATRSATATQGARVMQENRSAATLDFQARALERQAGASQSRANTLGTVGSAMPSIFDSIGGIIEYSG